jgi:trans-2,3-dihydro-3-hydroxyanthranilate isomerase
MKVLPILQIDAFTTHAYSGNPCAVVLDADELSVSGMQAIAREMNLSETAFVMHSDVADLRARYFTPAEEIPLAGHPTIATIFAMIATGRLVPSGPVSTISLQLEAGVIQVAVTDSNPPLITMSQRRPQFFRAYSPADVLPVFGLEESDALPGAPIMTVSTGTPQLMVPLSSLESLRRARLNLEAYAALRRAGDFFSPHLFVLQGLTEKGATFARHFGLPPDVLEDPFTGSATGGMAAYMWRHGLLAEPRFIAQQGHWLQRPGEAFVEVVGPREAIETVKVGGYAVEVMRGEIVSPEYDRGAPPASRESDWPLNSP